jgi:hypothetical protein
MQFHGPGLPTGRLHRVGATAYCRACFRDTECDSTKQQASLVGKLAGAENTRRLADEGVARISARARRRVDT